MHFQTWRYPHADKFVYSMWLQTADTWSKYLWAKAGDLYSHSLFDNLCLQMPHTFHDRFLTFVFLSTNERISALCYALSNSFRHMVQGLSNEHNIHLNYDDICFGEENKMNKICTICREAISYNLLSRLRWIRPSILDKIRSTSSSSNSLFL